MRRQWLCGLVMAIIGLAAFIYWMHPATRQQPAMQPVPTVAKKVETVNPLPIVEPPKITVKPFKLTPVTAKVQEEVHHIPMDRPMNVVLKNWLACQSKDLYSETEALLERQSPDALAVFQGSQPQCIMLIQGKKVTVIQKNNNDSSVEIQQEGNANQWWTGAAALADHVPMDEGQTSSAPRGF